jgi:DNA invertase Pin-like site-specific DNA recombinase
LEDAVHFFRAEGVKGTRAEIQEACEPYGYHPLALRLLAGLIAKDGRQPGDIRVAARHPVTPELKGKEKHHILQVAYDAMEKPKGDLLSRFAAFRSPMAYATLAALNPFKNERQFDQALDELTNRGLLLFDKAQARYDLHPVVRQYAYDRLRDKAGVHSRLRDYFANVPAPDAEKIQSMYDLAPVIELYHHTIRAGQYDKACELYRERLHEPLYYRFGAYQTSIELLRGLFPDGTKEARPGLNALMTDARRGAFDVVVVWRFDRFARSVRQLLLALEEFRSLGIDFISHQEALDTSTPMGRTMFTIIAAMAELERDVIRERTAAGLEYARRHGTKSGKPIGRPKVVFPRDQVLQLHREGLSGREIARRLDVGEGTVRRVLKGPVPQRGCAKTH